MNTIAIILISLIFSAFFSGMEIAYFSVNKLRMELDKKNKNFSSFFLAHLFRHPQQFISTMLVGNNIALVIYGLQMAILLDPPLAEVVDSAALVTLLQTIIATIIVLFTGEFLPKTIFRVNSNLWLKIFAFPLWLFYMILYPVSKFTTALAALLLRLLGLRNNKAGSEYHLNRTDLDYWMQESIDNVANNEEIEHEVKILQNALDFSRVKMKDCMVPRNEVAAFDKTVDLPTLKAKFSETGFSKILIFEEDIDHVVGYIHSSEMFRNAESWQNHIKPMTIVPETMPANKLLQVLMREQKSMAVVVDEFGGTAGIVTLEDIMEEIFGDIEDEHDRKRLVAKKMNNREYILSGRLEIDTVNQQFDLDIPESNDYVTVAGCILHHYQNFPKVNEIIRFNDLQFKILRVTNNKIELVGLKVLS
ncbi:MAG: hemolysin family protein [Prevotellaceae bacterium]|jgi:CBS domain containing-hemolysin-like protein|nr:hemolysin family protein [Prevotellaceae bacterium]